MQYRGTCGGVEWSTKVDCVMDAQELACRRGCLLTARAGGVYPGRVGQWVVVWGNLETTSGTTWERMSVHCIASYHTCCC